jgi:NADPH:quinone reductase-like Zn-dependent oxidoreductase
MKAIVHHRYGPLDVLAQEEIDKPIGGDDDVLISVHAAGVSYPDAVMTRGVPYIARLVAGLRRPKHGVRGTDARSPRCRLSGTGRGCGRDRRS